MTRRLPPRVWLGPHFYVSVILGTPAQLKKLLDEDEIDRDVEGVWMSEFENNDAKLGIIYINKLAGLAKRWEILRHELIHAIHDIDDWAGRHI